MISHPSLEQLRLATQATPWEGSLWLVGGAVRDDLLGKAPETDFDLVLESDAAVLADFLWKIEVSDIFPVTYPRFGTAMIQIGGANVELVTARSESYEEASRKPSVEPATLLEDAQRRDFTVNALLENLHSGELRDPLGTGLDDLRNRLLRTPLDPARTFFDDPLRMLRAVRFRWKLGFDWVEGLADSIRAEAYRLKIISEERIRDEFLKMLLLPQASDALQDLMELNLLDQFAPELVAMRGVEQGSYHHLDVWEHTLLALKNGQSPDQILNLGILLHDVGKPPTRMVDKAGRTRFFGHESVGATMAERILRRLRLPTKEIDSVKLLVKSHMRLGSAKEFTPTAARRLVRDLGDELDRLLSLCEADASALKPGVRMLDLEPIRLRIAESQAKTPRESLESPLTGREIMAELKIPSGARVGRFKSMLTEQVLDGDLAPGDKQAAREWLKRHARDY